MHRHLLPPRGIFIPTHMVFNKQLSPSVLFTWIQLRALAWDGWSTPSMSLKELAMITHKSLATLTRHITRLTAAGTISWQYTGHSKVILFFNRHKNASELHPLCHKIERHDQTKSNQPEPGEPASYFPTQILGYISYSSEED